MAPNQTALSTTMMSPLTTHATATTSQSKNRCPYADSAFGSKYQRLSSTLNHEVLTVSYPLSIETLRPSVAQASLPAGALNTATPDMLHASASV
eukprot:scaffold8181_cov78-Attheya_sp.AAC.1